MKNAFIQYILPLAITFLSVVASAGGGEIGSAAGGSRAITDRGMSSKAIEALTQVLSISNSESIKLGNVTCVAGNGIAGEVAECSLNFEGRDYKFAGKSAVTLAQLLNEMDAQADHRAEVSELKASSLVCGEISVTNASGKSIGKRSRCDGISQ